jgi:hypothetical protein
MIVIFPGSPSPLSSNAFFFTDTRLTLSGDSNILGRSLSIGISGMLACAPIVESDLFVSQFDDFPLDIIQQLSPYENSTLCINRGNPGVNSAVTILQDAYMINGICTNPQATYNPFNAQSSTGL